MLQTVEIKQKVGTYAAGMVQQGMNIGIGTGSTVYWFILALGERIRSGLSLQGVPTSLQSARLASENGIGVLELNEVDHLDLTIDGADEIDPRFQLIKGGGAALLREKMVAAASGRMLVIADERKWVKTLGAFPLPIEVIPFGWKQVQKRILDLGCPSVVLRLRDGKPLVTDQGHYLLDCHFGKINHPAGLDLDLHRIPGMVETGLFIGMATSVLIGYADGRIENMPPR